MHTVNCPSCSAALRLSEKALARTVLRCPKCQQPFRTTPPESPASAPVVRAEAPVVAAASETTDCPYCAEPIKAGAVKCRHCGEFLDDDRPERPRRRDDRDMVQPGGGHNPVVMALLSGLCIAGLGQIIMGQVGKGFIILLGGIVLSAVTVGAAAPLVWIFAGVDAYMIGQKLQQDRPVGKWEFF